MLAMDDFKSKASLQDLLLGLSNNHFAYDTVIGDDKFIYNATTGIIRVKTTNAKRGFFLIHYPNVTVGDIIECECEVRSISGVLPKILVEEVDTVTDFSNMAAKTNETVQGTKVGEWETLKVNSVIRNTMYLHARVLFGLLTPDVGEFEIRNIRTNLKRKTFSYGLDRFVKTFEIRKNGTAWEIRTDFSNSGATLTFIDNFTMQINYITPFTTALRPVPFATGDSYLYSNKYRPTASVSINTGCIIKLVNSANAFVDFTTVEDGTHFSFVAISLY